MLVYCTYCSAEKNHSEKPLHAIDLYKSERINTIFKSAETEGLKFVILSGKFGVLETHQKINYYDHLLMPSEVENHTKLVASQLKEKKITQIIFHMGSIKHDKNLKPYIDCIAAASAQSGVSIEFRESNFID